MVAHSTRSAVLESATDTIPWRSVRLHIETRSVLLGGRAPIQYPPPSDGGRCPMMGSVSPMGGGSAGQSIIGVWPDCANGVSLHGVAYTWPYTH